MQKRICAHCAGSNVLCLCCRLGLLAAEAAGRMCSCVHSGDLALLRNLMRAGIDVDAVRRPIATHELS